MSKAKPIHDIRMGRIKAAIWKNDTRNGTRHNVTFSRSYRDDHGNWHDTTNFDRDDLLLIAKVADLAHTWICQRQQNELDSHACRPKNLLVVA